MENAKKKYKVIRRPRSVFILEKFADNKKNNKTKSPISTFFFINIILKFLSISTVLVKNNFKNNPIDIIKINSGLLNKK